MTTTKLRKRPGDQALPIVGQTDVSRVAQEFITSTGEITGRTGVANLINADLEARIVVGEQRYGTRLQSFNGRDCLRDWYEEMCDAVHYAQQYVLEKPLDPRGRVALYTAVSMLFDVKEMILKRDGV